MKNFLLLILLVIFSLKAYSQTPVHNPVFSAGVSYSQQFVAGGFVQVREWDLNGDKMKLKELGMHSYPSLMIYVEKKVSNRSALRISYEKYFMNGKSEINRNIAYNGTLIDGSRGIDISPTEYYCLRLNYKGNLFEKEQSELYYQIGIIYDFINFFLDGVVAEGSPRSEVYEQFSSRLFRTRLLVCRERKILMKEISLIFPYRELIFLNLKVFIKREAIFICITKILNQILIIQD